MSLRTRRLLVLTGKGGVGRTTLSLALGIAAGRAGLRTCVLSLHGEPHLAHIAGLGSPSYSPRALTPQVDVRTLSPTDCLADFGQRKLRLPGLARWFFESRLMTGFIESVPGLADLVQLGKIEDMLNHPLQDETAYDLAILDGPATGHGLSLLAGARAMAEMTRVGPFFDLANIIATFLSDASATGFLVATLPEALPAQEATELCHALTTDHAPPAAVIVNQVLQPAMPDDISIHALRQLPFAAALAEVVATLAEDALRQSARQREALRVLRAGLADLPAAAVAPIFTAPRVATPPRGLVALEPLAEALAPLFEVHP